MEGIESPRFAKKIGKVRFRKTSVKPEIQSTRNIRPALIIPCHNRKAITLNCFSILRDQGVLEDYQTILVDDGSTDGTADVMREQFPQVKILSGDGSLFWTGAIELGMRHAYAAGASSFVWLNDDSTVKRSSIDAIVARAEALGGIVSGQGRVVVESQNFEWFFPLFLNGKSKLSTVDVDLTEEEVSAATCRGNLVAVSRDVVDTIGFPDGKHIPHYGGDTDYGLRATAAGLPLRILTGAVVSEEGLIRNDNDSWLLRRKIRQPSGKKHFLQTQYLLSPDGLHLRDAPLGSAGIRLDAGDLRETRGHPFSKTRNTAFP